MSKFKQFKWLLLIVMLVVAFTMQLETEADAGLPTISGKFSIYNCDPCDPFSFCYAGSTCSLSPSSMYLLASTFFMSSTDPQCCDGVELPTSYNFPPGDSLCSDAILKKLGRVEEDEYLLEFRLFNINVDRNNDNPACNSPTAEGDVHVGQSLLKGSFVAPGDVAHNGTAEVVQCFTYDEIKQLTLPNPNWTSCYFDLNSFDVGFLLTTWGTDLHEIRAHCEPYGDGVDWDCTVYYDSRD